MLKDSGQRRNFHTGAVRDVREGKGRCDLLPPRALLRLSKHFEAGAVKYGDRNWEKGMPVDVFIDSGLRHLFQYMMGERDEDHLCAASWNLVCAMEMEERYGYSFNEETPEESDFETYQKKEELKTIPEWEKEFQTRVIDPDGFDRTDPHLRKRLFTQAEFLQGIARSTCEFAQKEGDV